MYVGNNQNITTLTESNVGIALHFACPNVGRGLLLLPSIMEWHQRRGRDLAPRKSLAHRITTLVVTLY